MTQQDSKLYEQIWPDKTRSAPTRQQVAGTFKITTNEKATSSIPDKEHTYTLVNRPESGQHVDKAKIERSVSRLQGDLPVDYNVSLMETEQNKVRAVIQLSSMNNAMVEVVQTRIVCLFDISGSMMLKCGRSKKESKITKLKKMALDLVENLEIGDDYFGLVTFGEKSEVVLPLIQIDGNTKKILKNRLDTMNQKFSSHTDLHAGLMLAIDLLNSTSHDSKHLYRNAIFVFSDGEINKGITSPSALVQATHEQIVKTKPDIKLQADQWVNISCITTGSNVTEAMYQLSKFCGSDAYYYIDSKVLNPEINMMIPLVLRKSSVAQYLTLNMWALNGAELDRYNCSQKYNVRGNYDMDDETSEKITYYIHDFPSGNQKHFIVTLDLNSIRETPDQILKIVLQYLDNNGNIRVIEKLIRFLDIMTEESSDYDDCLSIHAKSDMVKVMQTHFRKSSDLLNQKSYEKCTQNLRSGKVELGKLGDMYQFKAKSQETKSDILRSESAMKKNLDSLILTIDKSVQGDGHKWTKLKAVSSSIVRETPNIANLVIDGDILCPLPKVNDDTNDVSSRLAALAKNIFQEQTAEHESMKHQRALLDAASTLTRSLGSMLTRSLPRSGSGQSVLPGDNSSQSILSGDNYDSQSSTSTESEDDNVSIKIN